MPLLTASKSDNRAPRSCSNRNARICLISIHAPLNSQNSEDTSGPCGSEFKCRHPDKACKQTPNPRESFFVNSVDYHLKKVIIITKGGSMEAHILKLTFSQAMQRYQLAIGARQWSEHTAKDYINTFNRFTAILGENLPIEDINHKQIEAFFFRSLF
jgi:hypothetical protein